MKYNGYKLFSSDAGGFYMKIDHTEEVEKGIETIPISVIDNCSFYAPKEGSFIVVNLCAYCKFSKFDEKNKNCVCKFRLVKY